MSLEASAQMIIYTYVSNIKNISTILVRRSICIMWNNFVTRGDKTSVKTSVNGEGRSRKSNQNKAEQELKTSDGHHILFTFILHSPREIGTISKKKKTKKKKNRGMVLSFFLSQMQCPHPPVSYFSSHVTSLRDHLSHNSKVKT